MNNPFKSLRRILILVFIASLLSCTTNKDEKIIPREEFVKIITDLHYTDAIITQRGFSALASKDSLPAYYHYILAKYDITIKSFENSLAYYSEDLDDLMAIYDEVISNINSKIPKKLNEKSIYKIYDLALEDAKVKLDPDKWMGPEGKALWFERKTKTISNSDSLVNAKFSDKLKYKCLLMLQSEILVYPADSSKNLRMSLKINYKDSSFDLIEKPIKIDDGKWTTNQLFVKTDSTKKTSTIECNVFLSDTLIGVRHGMIKNMFLKQYPYNKDTSLLIKKEPENELFSKKKKPPIIKKLSPKNKKLKPKVLKKYLPPD